MTKNTLLRPNCEKTLIVKSLDEVSAKCKTAQACKSKINSQGKFAVQLFKDKEQCNIPDPRKVFVKITDQKNKTRDLETLLQTTNFVQTVEQLCKKQGKEKSKCQISIKVNIAPASQKKYHYYTDPVIADHVVDHLNKRGFRNVRLVESETNAILADPKINPTNLGKALDFKTPVNDLTKDAFRIKIPFKEGKIELAQSMVESDVIINIPKPKNHDLMKFTGSLKNMYGSIPDLNKYMLFHHKESGLNVKEATVAVNHSTPADIIIADWVDSVDGNEVSYFDEKIKSFDHFPSNRLIYGTNPLFVDKYIARKMGYTDQDSGILTEEEEFVGPKKFKPKFVIGDDITPLSNWRKIGLGLNIKAKMQDYIPVNDKMVAWGIRQYAFPVIGKK
jgi:uncharacterized protein (DUF362 family)